MAREKEREKVKPTTQLSMTGSDRESSGWHTNPDNPMLSPNGQLHDADKRPQQFVYSPLETVATSLHLQANAKDDLPSALHKDINTARLKHNVKQIVHMNPLEVFKQGKLAAKKKNAAISKKNMSDVNKGTVDVLAKFGLHPNHLKIPAHPANKKNVPERTSVTVESSASEVESIKGQGVSRKCKKHP